MALGPGSIAFIGFDDSHGSALVFVTIDAITTDTTVYFTDRGFDSAGFSGIGLTWRWTASEPVDAGAVIRLTAGTEGLSASVGAAGFLPDRSAGFQGVGATIYAFLGSSPDTPTLFLAAFTWESEAPPPDDADPPPLPAADPAPPPAADPAPPPAAAPLTPPAPNASPPKPASPRKTTKADVAEPQAARPPSGDFADYLDRLHDPARWGGADPAPALTVDPADSFVVCFVAGTTILTADGPRAVETLSAGAVIPTADHGSLILRWVGYQTFDLVRHPTPHLIAPIMLARDAIEDGTPDADLLVSPDHALRIDGALIAARRLRNGMTIRAREDLLKVAYHHLEFDRHTLVMARGVAAESYREAGNRGLFANAGPPVPLHPAPVEALAVTAADDGIEPVWRRLRDRAMALGHNERSNRVTDDPAVSVWIDGQARSATRVDGATYTFMIPPNIRSIRLMSRAAPPSATRPWVADRRQLGVRVSRITIGDGEGVADVPLDHPALRDGWWGAERLGREITRWTDGDAALALPPCPTAIILRIRLAGQPTYPLGEFEALWPETKGQRGVWG